MDCSIGSSIFFCSISRGNRILYSHSIDRDLETLAAAIEGPPPFHSRYSHTAGDRTFAFLDDGDGHTFFAIADSSGGSAAAFRFLELMRESFRRSSKNGAREEFVPLVRRLICSLETLSRSGGGGGDDEKARGEELWIDMSARAGRSVPLEGSLSPRVWMQQNGRRLWWRHVKIVVAVDLLLCLVLFGIWLAVCRGFRCID